MCWVIQWRVLGYIVGCVLGYTMESVGLHCGVCWVTLQNVLGYIAECVGLHCGVCWVTLWGVLGYIVGCVGLNFQVSIVLRYDR